MEKKRKQAVKWYAGVEKKKSDYLKGVPAPLPPSPHNGEYSIEFNKYIVIYSNNFQGNLSSPWRAGGTSIDCYKDGNFVGVISFNNTAQNMGGGYVDGNGIAVVEYPIDKFEDIMRVLRTFNNLYLLIVERDLNGTPLAHRVGAVMTFQMKSIGS